MDGYMDAETDRQTGRERNRYADFLNPHSILQNNLSICLFVHIACEAEVFVQTS